MKFIIDSSIFEKFPELNIGVIVAKDLNNSGTSKDIGTLISQAQEEIRAKYETETLSQQPKINVWRKTYSAFGAKPKKYKSSIENLYRSVLGGSDLRSINKLVDTYNYISLKRMLPVGGEDLDKIQGDVHLTFATESEPEVTLLGETNPRPPKEGEVIYKDDTSTICRRWNWKEADRTKLSEDTKNCILVIEGLPPVTKNEIESATEELKSLVEKHCGGKLTSKVLDSKNPTIQI